MTEARRKKVPVAWLGRQVLRYFVLYGWQMEQIGTEVIARTPKKVLGQVLRYV